MSDLKHEDSMALLEKYRNGDQRAADILFQRHVGRLVSLAQRRISPQLGRRVDAEDIVQSALGTFFKRALAGHYTFNQRGDIWRLLAAITINKLRQKVEFHSSAKRRFDQDQSSDSDTAPEFLTREPAPDAELEVLEEVQHLTVGMDELQRRIVELRLQGYELNDIAADVSRSERTVRRVLSKIKDRLEVRLDDFVAKD